MGNPFTIIGNLTSDPTLNYNNEGKARANFRVASTSRRNRNGNWEDEGTLFVNCTAFGFLAENFAQSLKVGQEVIAVGNLKSRTYTDNNGNEQSSIEMIADACGPNMRRQVAQVRKAERQQQPQGGFDQGGFGGNQQPQGGVNQGGFGGNQQPQGGVNQGGFGGNQQPQGGFDQGGFGNDPWNSAPPAGGFDEEAPF